ncbi:hypothetical protein [Synechococcus sp. RS9916]|uniref:hypothetical protein n=1 Tax=Synechococcus sp. RS9916 TaxID=221359 RepID=UPI0000E54036|nr:hypothetical protein [Synechococcus sp. RS9916]EAU73615.1 hypothetical protein RS9916_28939 [Synechococcus sp. RS9916]
MSFDPRSMERLRQLGRQLPEPLAKPEPKAESRAKATHKRHRVETEENPQALFHELMTVSADGTVPEHLMARLKQAEQKAEDERRRQATNRSPAGGSATTPAPSTGAGPLPSPPGRQQGKGKNTQPRRIKVAPGSEEESMYVAFGQLFLEDDEDGA